MFESNISIWLSGDDRTEIEELTDYLYELVENAICPMGEGQPIDEHICVRPWTMGWHTRLMVDNEANDDGQCYVVFGQDHHGNFNLLGEFYADNIYHAIDQAKNADPGYVSFFAGIGRFGGGDDE